jgi:uncharacterized protein (TIGR03067 family)
MILLGALALGAPAPKDKPNPAEGLLGLWELERTESAKKEQPRQRDGPLRYRFEMDGTWVVLDGDKEVVARRPFKFDAKASPATLDLGSGKDGREMSLGIYKIEGDKLTICDTPPKQGRPTEFATPTGSVNYLMIFRRVKE